MSAESGYRFPSKIMLQTFAECDPAKSVRFPARTMLRTWPRMIPESDGVSAKDRASDMKDSASDMIQLDREETFPGSDPGPAPTFGRESCSNSDLSRGSEPSPNRQQ